MGYRLMSHLAVQASSYGYEFYFLQQLKDFASHLETNLATDRFPI